MSTLKVLLADEDAAKLKEHVYLIISEEIRQARQDAGLESGVMNQANIAKFLNISPTTVREYTKFGMPHGSINKRVFYDPIACKNWIMKQKID